MLKAKINEFVENMYWEVKDLFLRPISGLGRWLMDYGPTLYYQPGDKCQGCGTLTIESEGDEIIQEEIHGWCLCCGACGTVPVWASGFRLLIAEKLNALFWAFA